MSKIDEVRAAMVAAMKAKDKVRKDSLSMLLSALKNAEIDKRSPLTEEEENAVVIRSCVRVRKPMIWLLRNARISERKWQQESLFTRSLHRRI